MRRNRIYHGDCLELMGRLEAGSVDLIICDLPYGVTQNKKWDNILPYEELWAHYNRVLKLNGAVILFGQDKFTARTMLSNIKAHRYNLIWEKDRPTGFLNANRMPLRSHEDIMVFYRKLPEYRPQFTKGKANNSIGTAKGREAKNNNYGKFKSQEVKNAGSKDLVDKHPKSVLRFPKVHPQIHPTQKPVDLICWLINSYSSEGDLVLDNCIGSGTTAIAALQTGRAFIGMEKEEDYVQMSRSRVVTYLKQKRERLRLQIEEILESRK